MPRPRSESFYLKLAPEVSAVLSIQTKASLSAIRNPPPPPTVPTPLARPFSRTPSICTVALPDDADDERDLPCNPTPALARKRSNPELKLGQSSQPPLTRYPWSPKVPSPLRRDASKPFCPSSLFTTQTALLPLYPIASATPRPVHSLSLGPSTSECSLEGDAQELKPLARRRTPLHKCALKKAFFAGASGSSARRFGVRTAWNIDEDVRHSLAIGPFRSHFDFSSSEENDDNDDDQGLLSLHHSSDIEYAIEEAICEVQNSPGTRATAHKRSPSDHSEEDTSSGSDGSEEYSPSHFDEFSSDEEDGLGPENEETWDIISI
jgi:hypothetical protein